MKIKIKTKGNKNSGCGEARKKSFKLEGKKIKLFERDDEIAESKM